MIRNFELVKRHQAAFALGMWLASFVKLVDETLPGAIVATESFVHAVKRLRIQLDDETGANWLG